MRTYNTLALPRNKDALLRQYGEGERLYIYNGLDCCMTLEVLEAIRPQLDNLTSNVYQFSMDLQAPIFEMGLRGLLVDQHQKGIFLRDATRDAAYVEQGLLRMIREGWDFQGPFNWRSNDDLKAFFYDYVRLPVQYHRKTHQPTLDREALEKLTNYFHVEPIVNHILFLRDMKKLIEVLETEIDPDNRIRTTYNIGGTETGRLSSSESPWGTGGNLQNITERLRRIFIPDPGYKFAYIDLEQAESRAVGAMIWNLFHDGKYLDVCESSDPHTTVAKLVWPDLGWTGNLKSDRELAERPFYRHFSYRDMAKRCGHATNYGGYAKTISGVLKVPKHFVENFQRGYFTEFPGIRDYHYWIAKELQLTGQLTTPLGRRRYFFGRRDSDTTVREAIAYIPQSMVADIMNTGMLHIWRYERRAQLLEQVHDALLIQYKEEHEDELIPRLRQLISIPVPLEHGRTMVIPNDVKVGWAWANALDQQGNMLNPDGLMKYRGHDPRTRKHNPTTSRLDRSFL